MSIVPLLSFSSTTTLSASSTHKPSLTTDAVSGCTWHCASKFMKLADSSAHLWQQNYAPPNSPLSVDGRGYEHHGEHCAACCPSVSTPGGPEPCCPSEQPASRVWEVARRGGMWFHCLQMRSVHSSRHPRQSSVLVLRYHAEGKLLEDDLWHWSQSADFSTGILQSY